MKKLLLFGLLSFCANLGQSQTLLYNEDFDNGMPAAWSTSNGNLDIGLWTYCPNEQEVDENTAICPAIWVKGQNNQMAFNSTTAENGFMVIDSDRYAGLSSDFHNSHLNSSVFDFSLQSEVWLKFEYQIGVFGTNAKSAQLQVSTDGNIWKPYNIRDLIHGNNPYDGFVRWSNNPEMMIMDISEFAAGEEAVYLKWKWRAQNNFFWAIDDVAIYDGDPSSLWLPEHDLELTKYIAGAPNYMTPVSQVESFGFMGDFVNRSYQDIDSITFKASIDNPDGVQVFTDKVFIENAPADALKPDIFFPRESPIFAKKGIYSGRYMVNSTLTDDTPLNNNKSFTFQLTNNTFAKDSGPGGGTLPDTLSAWLDSEPHNWSWGNIYFVPNGAGFKATGISFAFFPVNGDTYSDIANTELNTILYEWDNVNANDSIEENELKIIYVAPYIVSGNEVQEQIVATNFEDIPELYLKNDTYYIAMLSFEAQPTADDILISTCLEVDYGSMMQRTKLLEKRRFASALRVESEKTDFDAGFFDIIAFGVDVIPVVRLHIDKITGTKDIAHPQQALLNIFPNPSNNTFQIQNKGIAFDNWNDVYIEVNAIDGKKSVIYRWGTTPSTSELINIEQFPAGTYQVTVASKSSALRITKTLMIQ